MDNDIHFLVDAVWTCEWVDDQLCTISVIHILR
jgi:hypothetical protein